MTYSEDIKSDRAWKTLQRKLYKTEFFNQRSCLSELKFIARTVLFSTKKLPSQRFADDKFMKVKLLFFPCGVRELNVP